MSNRHSMLAGAAVATLACGWGASPAHAVNIVLEFDNAGSENPYFDPQGLGLAVAMLQVEAMYEDLILDSHTLTIRYRWESDPTFGTLADHRLISKSGGREDVGELRFYASNGNPIEPRKWFVDPTPEDNSEFDLAPTLWRDLSTDDKARFNYGPNIPQTYEVAYYGYTNPSAPPAAHGYDLLTVAAHEVGHALGLNSSSEADAETDDGDFDFDPNFVNGRTLAARWASNTAHLAPLTLMHPILGDHSRMLPAMTDLFSMAAVDNFVSLDTKRREFWGGATWNTAAAWSGNRLPSGDDDVFIRDPSGGPLDPAIVTALTTTNGFCNNLFVGEGAWLSTNGFRLLASRSTTVDGTATRGQSSRIRIQTGGELESDNLTLVGAARLDMLGGLADINGTLKLANSNSLIDGFGTVDVLSVLNNNGRINASGGASPLNFIGVATAQWDLDGDLDGATASIIAVSGNLSFTNGTVSDAFGGSMTIGAGRTINIGPAWTLAPGGFINFTGAGATLGGGQVALNGRINATAGAASFTAALNAAGLPVIDVAAGATLNVTGSYLSAASASLTKSGQGAVVFSGPQNHAAGSQLRVNAGVVTLMSDAANLSIVSGASLNFASTQHLAALEVTGGRTQLLTGGGATRVLVTSALTVDTSDAFIDVWEHAVVVDYGGASPSPVGSIRAAIGSAYNNGSWNGFGITSSLANATHGVGYAEAAALGLTSFAGETVDATAVLVKFTFSGDANLDGQVNVTDLGALATNWQSSGDWTAGDFNYDGLIDVSDLGRLATNWQAGVGSPLGKGSLERALASVGLAGISVPEPTNALLALLLSTRPLLRRNRRRGR